MSLRVEWGGGGVSEVYNVVYFCHCINSFLHLFLLELQVMCNIGPIGYVVEIKCINSTWY
jgi:hypothetical protein